MYPTLSYYHAVDPRASIPVRGGIYWSCFQFAYSGPSVERVHRDARPISTLDIQQFNPGLERADATDGTASNEFLAVQKFKQRPVIVLSTSGDIYLETVQKRWKGGQHVLVAPLYSVWDETNRRFEFPSDFLLRAIRYDYASTFFLPGSHNFDLIAGIARFEYTQAVHISWLKKYSRGVMLSETALQFLEEWFSYFMTGTVSETFSKELTTFREYLDQEGNVTINTTYYPDGMYDD